MTEEGEMYRSSRVYVLTLVKNPMHNDSTALFAGCRRVCATAQRSLSSAYGGATREMEAPRVSTGFVDIYAGMLYTL
jgi:hypothetical protein